MEEAPEEFGVARERGGVVADRRGRKKDAEHRSALRHLHGQSLELRGGQHRVTELPAQAVEALVGILLLQQPKTRDAGCHGKRVTTQRSGLVNRPEWRQVIHDIGAPAEGSHGQPTADDFSEAGEVRGDLFPLLHAALRDAKASHDLIENQYRAVPRRDVAQIAEVAGIRHDKAYVAAVGLDDHAGDLTGIGGEDGVEGSAVVVRNDDRFRGKRRGHPSAVGIAVGQGAGARLDQQRVGVTMVATGKFHDLVAPGETTRETDRRHRRLRATVAHPYFLNGRHEAHDQLRHLNFVRVRGAE